MPHGYPLSKEGVRITSPEVLENPDMDVGGDMPCAHSVNRGNGKLTGPADTSTTKSKESSFQIAEFFIDHPILAMLVLGLIALIGSICIFALPIG
jgi:hypothetical protein